MDSYDPTIENSEYISFLSFCEVTFKHNKLAKIGSDKLRVLIISFFNLF